VEDKYLETLNTWNKVAELYQEKFMPLTLYDDSYNFLINHLNNKAPVLLDVGCGPGNISKYLKSKNPQIEVHGIDASPNMIHLAKNNIPDGFFSCTDIRNIDSVSGKYGVVTCGFVIPYLSPEDCNIFFKNCRRLLKTKGLIYLSFVEGDAKDSGYISGSTGNRTFFNYYRAAEIKLALQKIGFDMLKEFVIEYKKSNNHFENHHVLIAQLKSDI
jgi:2-polyprenyl-3-methyl-5-hydroxy-6-metoxy-1,4-benzoquinol methylase